MTIELSPVGVACNLDCDYCYQKPMRDAGNITQGYNLELMKQGLEREGGAFSVHGGEALLTPLFDVLEEIFAFGLQKYGQNGVQTNGALVTDAHVALFKKYRVHVGFSLDGPGELNDSRWAGTLQKTRRATTASHAALARLCAEGVSRSVIVTLYRGNATGDRLPRLLQWIQDIHAIGVEHIRIHLLEVEGPKVREEMALSLDENYRAMAALYDLQKRAPTIKFDVFREMVELLLGQDAKTCIWHACDPYTTSAVRGVDGMGESSNCGRTNKDGVNWQKANAPGFERQVALYLTPQSDLGCQDCRFFFACKGQCPGTAVDGDWRNRTEHCEVWMRLFTLLEQELVGIGRTPLSLSPLRPAVEQVMMQQWSRGKNVSISQAVRSAQTGTPPHVDGESREHGDHWDAPNGYTHEDAPYVVHGDAGKTVMHGDSDARL